MKTYQELKDLSFIIKAKKCIQPIERLKTRRLRNKKKNCYGRRLL